jgi:hypothetical protein
MRTFYLTLSVLFLLVGVGAGAMETEKGYINTTFAGYIPGGHCRAEESVSDSALIVTDFYPYTINSPQGNGTVRHSEHIGLSLERVGSIDEPYSLMVTKDEDVVYEESLGVDDFYARHLSIDIGPAVILNESEVRGGYYSHYEVDIFKGEGSDKMMPAYYELYAYPSAYNDSIKPDIQQTGLRVSDVDESFIGTFFKSKQNATAIFSNRGAYGFHGVVKAKFYITTEDEFEIVEKEFKCTMGPGEEIPITIGTVPIGENYEVKLDSLNTYRV